MMTGAGLSPGRKRPYILPLNNPPVVAAAAAAHMRSDDTVIGVIVEGRSRAYPWWIAANYHVINDSIMLSDQPAGYLWSKELSDHGKESNPWYHHLPLLVTVCEACAAVAAFIPTLDDAPDNPLVFAVCDGGPAGSYQAVGTFTIADVQTHTRWHPFTGRAKSGLLAPRWLRRVPAFTDSWAKWVRDHPQTDVALAGEEMRHRPHVRDLPAVDDPQAAHTSLRIARFQTPDLIDLRREPVEMVLGVGNDDGSAAIACPLAHLREAGGAIQYEFDGEPCLFVLQGDYRGLVLDRRLDGEVLDFTVLSSDPLQFQDRSGSVWNYLGEAVAGRHAGRRLPMLPDSYVSKWSEWSLAHPSAVIMSGECSDRA